MRTFYTVMPTEALVLAELHAAIVADGGEVRIMHCTRDGEHLHLTVAWIDAEPCEVIIDSVEYARRGSPSAPDFPRPMGVTRAESLN